MLEPRAPVSAESEIQIVADIEKVWTLITDINRWPKWNPDVKQVSLNGEITEGLIFKWKAGSGTITSVIQRIERPRLLIWTGKTLGIRAVHTWRLEPQAGKTMVRSEESWDGLLPRVLPGLMRKILAKSLDVGLRYLKTESERLSN